MGDTTTSATLQVLRQTHEDYDPARFRELSVLYEGGFAIQKRAAEFCPTMSGEHPERHKGRCSKTSYQPYFAQITNDFVSELFGQPLTMGAAADADNPDTPGTVPDAPYYAAFAKDVDKQGHSLVDLLADVLTTALVQRWGIIQLDAPAMSAGEPPPATLAEERQRGGKAMVYAYEVPIEQLIDWKVDGDSFAWCVLRTCTAERATPLGTRNLVTETFMVWELEDGSGDAIWSKYEVQYPKDKPPEATSGVPLVAKGRTSFKRIPIFRLELSHGLWLGNKIGTQAREHYARRCELVGAESDSCYAIPVVFLGSEIGAQGGALPSELGQDPNRAKSPVREFKSKGWMALGGQDRAEMLEPSGAAYTIVQKDLDALRDSMYGVANQMAASVRPTPSALGRSGLSKQEDGKSTAKVLRALGLLVRGLVVKIYDAIAEARGESVVWAPSGLDHFEVDDRESVLEEAISLDQIDIPSETFKRTHTFEVARKLLPGTTPQTMAQIKAEIEAGVSQQMAHDQLAREAAEQRPPIH